MRKVTILLGLLCVVPYSCGVYSSWSENQFKKNLSHARMKSINEASSSSKNKFSNHDAASKKKHSMDIATSSCTDSEIKKKIRDFAENLRSNVYDTKQVEEALVECLLSSNYSESGSAKKSISLWTLARWVSELGLGVRYRDQKSTEIKEKLISAFNKNIEWKNIHKIIGKKRNETINLLRKLQDKGLIYATLDEQKRRKLIQDFREKLITHKGLARKYNIKESEVYCIIHEARQKKQDLSLIKIKWHILYKNRQALSEQQKREIVKDYNKGLLTVQGICVKHGISEKVAQYVIYRNNNGNIKRRNGRQQKRNKELVLDIQTKSSQEIERKYGYTSVYVDEMKRFVNQWNLLTDDQKNIFNCTILSGVLPTKSDLSSIEKSLNRNANEKFEKLLFVSVSTYEDVMAEYGILRRSVTRLVRELDFWKILSAEEQRRKILFNSENYADGRQNPLQRS